MRRIVILAFFLYIAGCNPKTVNPTQYKQTKEMQDSCDKKCAELGLESAPYGWTGCECKKK